MDKILKSYLMTLLVQFLRNFAFNKSAARKAVRLRIKLSYLKIIKACRLLFITYLGIGIFLVFLFSGLILFHVTFFLFSPYSSQTKMWVGFAFAFVYLFIAVKAFLYAFSEEKWLSIFQAEDIFKELENMPLAQKEDSEQEQPLEK